MIIDMSPYKEDFQAWRRNHAVAYWEDELKKVAAKVAREAASKVASSASSEVSVLADDDDDTANAMLE